MTVQTKQQQLKEIEYQEKMLNNLKKWMRNLMILSSIGVVIAYWALNLQRGLPYQMIGIIGVILAAVSVVFCAAIGLAFKNGKTNVEKIIHLVEQ